jgi:hypothetical protein
MGDDDMANRDPRRNQNDQNATRDQQTREPERQASGQGRKPPGRAPEASEPSRDGAEKGSEVEEVVERLLDLPYPAQLSVLRSVAPQIIAHLDGNDQEAFLRALENEVQKVAHGDSNE